MKAHSIHGILYFITCDIPKSHWLNKLANVVLKLRVTGCECKLEQRKLNSSRERAGRDCVICFGTYDIFFPEKGLSGKAKRKIKLQCMSTSKDLAQKEHEHNSPTS